ncbi:MAG: zinc-binding dehydrogenase [Planctomycetota bacterium]
MRALVIEKQADPVAPNVALRHDFPDLPPPGPGEARIKTLCSALNHLDLWIGKGVPGLTLEYPRVAGCDGCGVVEAVGEGVPESWIGTTVMLNAALDMSPIGRPTDPTGAAMAPAFELIGEHHSPGTHAEHFNAPVAQLAALPGEIDPAHAAAFGLSALTAWSMMVGKAGLQPGQYVLVTGIGGGVATAALAIAKHFGCPACVTSRHRWKLDRATELGADHVILDEGQDWSRDVRGWTGKRGVDLAVDSIGKAVHLWCIKALARGGAYVTPGCTSGPDATTDLARIFWNQLRVLGSTMGSNDEFKSVAALFAAGKLSPVVDQVIPSADGQKAYERLESGEQFGKVVVDWR